jgi:hypothetical protein
MTKAFLETIVLKPENEKFVIEAFSKHSIKKVKEFNLTKRVKLKKTSNRKLSISDLSVLS